MTSIAGSRRRGPAPRAAALRSGGPLDGRDRRDGDDRAGARRGSPASPFSTPIRAPRRPRSPRDASPRSTACAAGGLREVMRDEMKPNYLADGPGRESVLDLCMEMAMRLRPGSLHPPVGRAPQTGRTSRRPSNRSSVPTLVLCGAEDRLCPVERHMLMHRLSRTRRSPSSTARAICPRSNSLKPQPPLSVAG